MEAYFSLFLVLMSVMGLVVFVSLFFVDAGYGKFSTPQWGPSINNKWGWFLMESPVFIGMVVLWALSERRFEPALLVMFGVFELHYFQRSFVFPFLLRGKSKMPLSIVLMGVLFNVLNALMQGGWLFYVSSPTRYAIRWLKSPQFIVGTCIFILGFIINLHSDYVIRHLRSGGDTKHYLPCKGMYKYVTSANYFGELLEWTGFALLTWSAAGAVFAWWTFANLVPRAVAINKRYRKEFEPEMAKRNLKCIIPWIY